jgi:hypothetical protein
MEKPISPYQKAKFWNGPVPNQQTSQRPGKRQGLVARDQYDITRTANISPSNRAYVNSQYQSNRPTKRMVDYNNNVSHTTQSAERIYNQDTGGDELLGTADSRTHDILIGGGAAMTIDSDNPHSQSYF